MFVTTAIKAATFEVVQTGGTKAAGAEVFVNCTRVGTTDGTGWLSSPVKLASGDRIQARLLVKTGTTAKPEHDGWGYHVYITNVLQNDGGTQTDFTVTQPAGTQTIVLNKENAQIGLHMVASIDYNATDPNLADIAASYRLGSEYMWDVTDGQMFFEQIDVAEDGMREEAADVLYRVDVLPNVPWPFPSFLTADGRMYMPGPGFDGQGTAYGAWRTRNGFRTLIHEVGHQVFGAHDEYKKTDANGEEASSSCTTDRAAHVEAERQSIMDYQYDATEICDDATHNTDTWQQQHFGTSVWGSFVSNWSGDQWTLKRPKTRGKVNPGPTNVACTAPTTVNIHRRPGSTCEPILVTVAYQGQPASGFPFWLTHDGRLIGQGRTNSAGQIRIYGAVNGDVISTFQSYGNKSKIVLISGGSTVQGCGSISMDLRLFSKDIFYQIPRFRRKGVEFTAMLPVRGRDFVREPVSLQMNLRQGPGREVQVPLVYDARNQAWAATVPVDRVTMRELTATIEVKGPQGTMRMLQHAWAAVFNKGGPGVGPGQSEAPQGTAPPAWDLFGAEAAVNIVVRPDSLLDGTTVTVATTLLPEGIPSDLHLAAGPYSVAMDQGGAASFGLEISYQLAPLCGVQKDSISIHHFDGANWSPVASRVDETRHIAFASVNKEGIYTVLGRSTGAADAEPRIECPANVRETAPRGSSALDLSIPAALGLHPCGDVQVRSTRSDGKDLDHPFPIGTTTITWETSERRGKTASCTSVVVVEATPGSEASEPPPVAPGRSGCHCSAEAGAGARNALPTIGVAVVFFVGLRRRRTRSSRCDSSRILARTAKRLME